MGAVLMIARIQLRRRWRSVVVIALVIMVAGGVVLAALAGARRTSSALDRLRAETRASNAAVDVFDGADPAFAARIGHLPGVEAWAQLEVWAANIIDPSSREETPIVAAVDGRFGRSVDRTILVDGRRARTAHEVVLPENVARRRGFRLGSRIRIATFVPDQLAALQNGQAPRPAGPTIPLRVVGINRSVHDLTTDGQRTGIIVLGAPVYRAYHRAVLSYTAVVRVRLAPGTSHEFATQLRAIAGHRAVNFDTGGLDTSGVEDSLGILGKGLLVFALIGALGALVTLGVLVARWASGTLPDQPVEHALGLSARQRAAAAVAPLLPAILGGAVGATGLAALASPLMPMGTARQIEPHRGFDLDALVLGAGPLALVAITAVVSVVITWFAARRTQWDPARQRVSARGGRWITAVTGWRVPVPAVIGSRMALGPRRGAAGIPGRSAIAAAALGVTGIVAALLVGSSLQRLTNEPARYAWHYDTIVEGGRGLSQDHNSCAPRTTTLASMPEIAAIATLCESTVTLDGRPVNAMGLQRIRGTIRPTILRGRVPTRPREIAVGEKTLRALGRSIGDPVVIRGDAGSPITTQIVGTTLFPTPNSHDTVSLADGVLMSADALRRLGDGSFPQVIIRWRPGIELDRAMAQVERRSGAPGIPPVRPPEIDRLLQVDRLPALLGSFLALLGLVGVGHAVVTNSTRRRRDLALLQTLGFRTRQVAATITAHAVTLVLVGLVIGVPLGIVVGRIVWESIARAVGIAPDAALPGAAILLSVLGALLAAVTVAVFPARSATRVHPAVALRSE